MVAERKQITVLFADVVGSMRLAATLESERLREIMDELFNRSAEIVQRYQGTVDKFTGDGLMALFGAPVALEDHALRACVAALEIQSMVGSLAADVMRCDQVELRLRIGLNSGEVIAGEIGIGPGSYTAVGHPVGMAQRMEAAANPGGVMCAESTARLVERSAVLGPVEQVMVKGASEPVPARRLEGLEPDRAMMGRDDGPLVGRAAELAVLTDAFDGARTPIATVMGEPGLGKSRLLREFASHATATHADIVITRCESHTASIPLYALSRMLRAMFGIRRLDDTAARAHVNAQLSVAGKPDSMDGPILFDLLSISDPEATPMTTSEGVRRRRLIDIMRRRAEHRAVRTVFVVEDVHWLDAATEDTLVDFAATLTATPSMLVASFRPGYRGALRQLSGTAVELVPLTRSLTRGLVTDLVGPHPSLVGLARRIADHSGGNPFFVEEIVRDLADRSLLQGDRGDYQLVGDQDAIAVPATVQSVLAARIDRLPTGGKAILNAAAVIGSSFELDVLEVLVPDTQPEDVRNLISAELIEQIEALPARRYAFRHPLVRAVAYESQLAVTRKNGHRRLASAIEARDPIAAAKNSALIAQHLEAAGDLNSAYGWYMRSGEWLSQRDAKGARESWKRARSIADDLPAAAEGVIARRIAPRAQLAFKPWLIGDTTEDERQFDELRQLATQSGDSLSLAMGMAGRVTSLVVTHGRPRDAAVLASELMALIDELDGTAPEMAELLIAVAFAHYETGAAQETLRAVGRLCELEPSPSASDLASATCLGGVMKVITGRRADGNRDLDAGLRLGRTAGPVAYALALGSISDLVLLGFDLVNEALVAKTREALRLAEPFGDDYALALARWVHGIALLRTGNPRRDLGIELLHLSREDGLDIYGSLLDAEIAADMMRRGQWDFPIDALSVAVHEEIELGETLFVAHSIAVLVRLLLHRRAIDQARGVVAAFEAQLPVRPVPAVQLWLLQYRALLARAEGEVAHYHDVLRRYRGLAEEFDALGHLEAAAQLSAETDLGV